MTSIKHVDTERSAVNLAALLNGNTRRRPVVVVTVPSGRSEPWIDVDQVAREAGDLAEVYLMPTNQTTWVFSDHMPQGTQVYGGAGRIYPMGHQWTTDLSVSPLRFAFDADEGQHATTLLVSDMLRMAAAAGVAPTRPARTLRQVSGKVTGVIAGRALVDVGAVFPAAIAAEMTVADVSIDRMVVLDQHADPRPVPYRLHHEAVHRIGIAAMR